MGLVYIGKVIDVQPIPDADRIEQLTVVCGKGGKWNGVAPKNQLKLDDLCVVYLQDSLVPHTPEFAFMEQRDWRVRMMRFKGVPSECLIMPVKFEVPEDYFVKVGDDVTERMGVTKYEKPVPQSVGGDILAAFPTFIPKTDEPNFQTVPEMIDMLRGKPFYATVKADGSSATAYWHEGHFGCCSRNWELKDTPNNAIWSIAKQYSLEDRLQKLCNKQFPNGLALQWETVGPGIQNNPLGLKQIEPRLFDIYDIGERKYFNNTVMSILDDLIGLPVVEVLNFSMPFLFNNDEELRQYAEGEYPNGHEREGVVIRASDGLYLSTGERISFKVINLKYKD